MSQGKIIFLNGTSSSGKTVLAKELQNLLDEPYLHFSIDTFLDMLPEKYLSGDNPDDLQPMILQAISGMHHCIAAMASAGNNVIVDHVLQHRQWLKECVDLLRDYPVLFVGLNAPLEELERRERERDRGQGIARIQYDLVHAHGIYDLELDTSIDSPIDCALQVNDALRDIDTADAFRRIRFKLAAENTEEE